MILYLLDENYFFSWLGVNNNRMRITLSYTTISSIISSSHNVLNPNGHFSFTSQHFIQRQWQLQRPEQFFTSRFCYQYFYLVTATNLDLVTWHKLQKYLYFSSLYTVCAIRRFLISPASNTPRQFLYMFLFSSSPGKQTKDNWSAMWGNIKLSEVRQHVNENSFHL